MVRFKGQRALGGPFGRTRSGPEKLGRWRRLTCVSSFAAFVARVLAGALSTLRASGLRPARAGQQPLAEVREIDLRVLELGGFSAVDEIDQRPREAHGLVDVREMAGVLEDL